MQVAKLYDANHNATSCSSAHLKHKSDSQNHKTRLLFSYLVMKKEAYFLRSFLTLQILNTEKTACRKPAHGDVILLQMPTKCLLQGNNLKFSGISSDRIKHDFRSHFLAEKLATECFRVAKLRGIKFILGEKSCAVKQ